jgi:hypothetical protein
VGIELLAEAGNLAAVQNLYGRTPWGPPGYPGAAGFFTGTSLGQQLDMYYRQAAAALHRPLPYKLLPGLGSHGEAEGGGDEPMSVTNPPASATSLLPLEPLSEPPIVVPSGPRGGEAVDDDREADLAAGD